MEKFSVNLLYDYPLNRTGQINASPLITVADNVRLDKFNEVQGITKDQPLPKEGETDCLKVVCPNHFPSTATCWKCS